MKKKKLLLPGLLTSCLFFSTLVYAQENTESTLPPENTPSSNEPVVEWLIPQHIKIGQEITDEAIGKNLPYSSTEKRFATVTSPACMEWRLFGNNGYTAHGYGPEEIKEDGTAFVGYFESISAFHPGTITLQFSIADENGNIISTVGNPYTVTVDEPIINHNAPQTVKSGDSISLETELTNTALVNTDVAYYYNPENYMPYLIPDGTHKTHVAAYQPSVEIIEGQNLVTQSEQDYSHTLSTSEKLTFNGSGTVKLKVVYNQIANCAELKDPSWGEGSGVPYNPAFYSPEEVITIKVESTEIVSDYKEQLKNKLEEISNSPLSEDEYTPESWTEYINAINGAAELLNNGSATEEEYKNALLAIEDAQKNLVKIKGSEPTKVENPTIQTTASTEKMESNAKKAPKTGDTSDIASPIALMTGAIIVSATALYMKKKAKKY